MLSCVSSVSVDRQLCSGCDSCVPERHARVLYYCRFLVSWNLPIALALQLSNAIFESYECFAAVSYQALARQYRPALFTEVLGQAHVVTALSNALDGDRIHHAYLFTGTRGVGKTTLARIFAKALNCLTNGVSATPCGTCSACASISEGRFIDLIEVDAASRTKVEDTRDLLDNVQYAPTAGRYKVYLIDEVHMLSNSSFNALLKTLEEPPPHVKFLLATTDPQKLPVTVLSRCLQFNLKALSLEQITEHLGYIVEKESVQAEPAALRLLARSAEGSVRDSLSLLDQAIAYGNGTVLEGNVRDMLGLIDDRFAVEIVSALAANDMSSVLDTVSAMAERSIDFRSAFDDLTVLLHAVALEQQVPGISESRQADTAELGKLASLIPVDDVQLYYQSALIGKRDLSLAPDGRTGFEMALLRMSAFQLPVSGGHGSSTQGSTQNTNVDRAAPNDDAKTRQASTLADTPAVSTNRAPPATQTETHASRANSDQADSATHQSTSADIVSQTVKDRVRESTTESARETASKSVSSVANASHRTELASDARDIPSTSQTDSLKSTVEARKESAQESATTPAALPSTKTADSMQPSSGVDAHMAVIRQALGGHKTQPNSTAGDNASAVANGEQAPPPAAQVNRQSPAKSVDPLPRREIAKRPIVPSTLAHQDTWRMLIETSALEGTIREFAMNMEPVSCTDSTLTLRLSDSHGWLLEEARVKRLQALINQRVTHSVTLHVQTVDAPIASPAQNMRSARQVRQRNAETTIHADPHVTALCQTFGAQIVEKSITPTTTKSS